MKKSKPTIQTLLLESEQRIREQAEQIIAAKEAGINPKSLNKMIDWLSMEKTNYDTLKRRFEGYGK